MRGSFSYIIRCMSPKFLSVPDSIILKICSDFYTAREWHKMWLEREDELIKY